MTKRNLLQRLLDERVGAERDSWQRLEQRLAPSAARSRRWVLLAPIALVVMLLAVLVAPSPKPGPPPAGREALHIYISRSDHPALEVTLRAER